MNNKLPNPYGTPVSIELDGHTIYIDRMPVVPRRKEYIYYKNHYFKIDEVFWSMGSDEWNVTLEVSSE